MFSDVIKRFLKLLCPTRCAACGIITRNGIPFCPDCMRSAVKSVLPCKRCGNPMSLCECYELDGFLYRFIAFQYIGAGICRSLYRMKRSNDMEFFRFYARIIAHEINRRTNSVELGLPFEAVTYVPRARKNVRRCGVDQAQFLARAIADELGLKCVRMLKRKRKSVSQKQLTYEGRLANALNLFLPVNIGTYRSVLLVDDIITSGATVTECAKALKKGGIKRVSIAAAAKTVQKKKTT